MLAAAHAIDCGLAVLLLAGMPASVQAQSETWLVGEWHFDGDANADLIVTM